MSEVEGFGTRFLMGGTSGDEIAKIIAVTPMEPEASDIDNTHMQSPAHHRTFQAGLVDGGEAEIEAIHTDESFDAVTSILRQDESFSIVYSDNSSANFDGYVKKVGNAVEMDGLKTFKFTCKVSGPVTYG